MKHTPHTRRSFDKEFKAKIALEAIENDKTLQEIAAEHHVSTTQVSEWKQVVLKGAALLFERISEQKKLQKQERQIETLQNKIAGLEQVLGQKTYEVEWLQKKFEELGELSNEEKTQLLETDPRISRSRQCFLLGLKRSTSYYKHHKKPLPLELCNALQNLHKLDPCLGYRKLPILLKREYDITASQYVVRRVRKQLGLVTVFPHKDTSAPDKGRRKLKKPYLLKDLEVNRRDQVWSSDITYLPKGKGFCYLCAIIDWGSREVIAWTISNSMEANLCVSTLEKALATGRKPQIINTDQGSQYTSEEWTNCVTENGIQISMDGKGRWRDNVRIERFWRTCKHEKYLLREEETLGDIRRSFAEWVEYYNNVRPHQALGYDTPAAWREANRDILPCSLPTHLEPPPPTGLGAQGAPVGSTEGQAGKKNRLTDQNDTL